MLNVLRLRKSYTNYTKTDIYRLILITTVIMFPRTIATVFSNDLYVIYNLVVITLYKVKRYSVGYFR